MFCEIDDRMRKGVNKTNSSVAVNFGYIQFWLLNFGYTEFFIKAA